MRATPTLLIALLLTVVATAPASADEDDPGKYYYLSNALRGGEADETFAYGRADDEVFVGDWNRSGNDTLGVRRGSTYYLSNTFRGGAADVTFTYGRADDEVFFGDWNGNGVDTPAVRRGRTFYVTNRLRGGDAEAVFIYGRVGDVVLVGDWNGNGKDTFGVRRGSTYYLNNALRGGAADATFTYGRTNDEVFVGDWNRSGNDTLGVRRGSTFYLNNALRGGAADATFTYGRADDQVLVGDWNGNGGSTFGVRRPQPPSTAPVPEPKPEPEPSGELDVHFIDVGQGDATLLTHEDTAVLVDTGRYQATDVVDYVTSLGIDELDLVIVTHPHADHIGQFDKLVDAVTITETWWSGSTTTSQTFGRAVDALERSGAAYEEPRSGDAAQIGSLLIEVANPPEGVNLTNVHDAGLAVRVTFGSFTVLFTGDAEVATENRMVSQNPGLLGADILQVGHHGSNTSTGPAFLSAVSPSVAVYSASATNQYGHPHTEVLDRLAAAGVEVYGTDTHGTVVITSDGQGWSITTERQPSGGDTSSGPTPPQDEEPPATSGCGPGQVDINRADVDSLQQIIHIGPDRAQQIIDLRPFSSVSDMDRIDGIGPARLADIEDQGVACVG